MMWDRLGPNCRSGLQRLKRDVEISRSIGFRWNWCSTPLRNPIENDSSPIALQYHRFILSIAI